MNTIRILFSESGVSLPDGTNCGVQGEHNAVQIVITLPESMIDGCDYHVITFIANDGNAIPSDVIQTTANADGAYRDGRTIYQPLTAAYTQNKTFEIVVTGYRQDDDRIAVVDRTKPVSLWLTPVPGYGKAAYPSGLESHVKELSDYIKSMKSGNADEINRLLMNALGRGGGAKVDEYADLIKSPMTLMNVGVKADVRKTTKYNRYGFWHGLQPQKDGLYGIIYFSPKLPDIRLFIPEECPHSFSAVAYFERENEDCWRVELSYFKMLSDFAVMVTDRSHSNTNYSHYYYLYEDKSVWADGAKHELYEGWNHGYVDAETGLLTYEPSDAPDPLFDVKCTSMSVNGDKSYNAFSVFAMACRPDTPYLATMRSGVYVKTSDHDWAMTNDVNNLADFRQLRVHVRNDAAAWSFGQQTVYVPGVLPGDRVLSSDEWAEMVDDFSIISVQIRHDSITFMRDSTKALPDHDVSITPRFIAQDPVIPNYADVDFSEITPPKPKEGHIHDYHVVATIDPTCTDGGYTYHRCDGCDDIYIDNQTDALGHDWGAWEVTTAATAAEDGEETRICRRCGAAVTRPFVYVEPEPAAAEIDDEENIDAPAPDACEHSYPDSFYYFTWSPSYDVYEVGFRCSKCGHIVSVRDDAPVMTVIQEADDEHGPIVQYTARISFNGTVHEVVSPEIELSQEVITPEPLPVEPITGPGGSAPEEIGIPGGDNDGN